MCVSYNDHRHTAISGWQHCVRNLGLKPHPRLKTPLKTQTPPRTQTPELQKTKNLAPQTTLPTACESPELTAKAVSYSAAPRADGVMVARIVGAEIHLVFGKDGPRSLWWSQPSGQQAPTERRQPCGSLFLLRPVSVMVYNL